MGVFLRKKYYKYCFKDDGGDQIGYIASFVWPITIIYCCVVIVVEFVCNCINFFADIKKNDN